MTTTYQTPAAAAAEIRQKLKALYGITSRQVGIRARSFSMGSAIDIYVHDPAVDIREVHNCADSKEKIARCQITGEILNGGNRYLSVAYSKKAAESFAAANAEAIAKLVSDLPPVGSRTGGPRVEIDGRALIVCRGQNGIELNIRDTSACHLMPAWIPQADYLAKPEGKVAVAESILGMRSGSA